MIHFVFPIYNEKENLSGLIAGIRRAMAGRAYRIVAVDDGSNDGSLELLQELRNDDLVITGSIMNMNVGAVFSAGIYEALKGAAEDDVIVIMESDQTSEQELILPMAKRITSGEADIVVASRYLPGGRHVNFPLPRLVFSHCANWLMRVFFPLASVHDYTIFFRAYRAGILKKASRYFGPFGLIQSKGFVANAELLIKLALFTNRIAEVPFVYNYGKKKGASKIHIIRTINEYFVLINYMNRIFRKVEDFKKRKNIRGEIL
ncbi:MAG: glycosyltransferase [Candidatus Omnitrophica bacterium]|nr:glycosyltransferase [Candidatus Omnitrophota bacterium]